MPEGNPYDGMTPEEAAHMKRLLGGVGALITVSGLFLLSPDGSEIEKHSGIEIDEMIDRLAAQPGKAHEVIMTLLSIISHVRVGNTLDSWFENTGVELPHLPGVPRP